MSNQMFISICQQLSNSGAGSLRKFDEIFNASVKYFHAEHLLNNTFPRFVYFQFLVESGVLEVLRIERETKWVFCQNQFVFISDGAAYQLPISVQDCDPGLKFFQSDLGMLPSLVPAKKHKSAGLNGFREKLFALKFDAIEFSRKSFDGFSSIDPTDYNEGYDFLRHIWVELESDVDFASYAIIRSTHRVHGQMYFYQYKETKLRSPNSEDVFHLALIEFGLKGCNLVINQDSTLLVKWKFKLPSILRRTLVASSSRVIYESNGTRYALVGTQAKDGVLKHFGVEK